MKLIRFTKTMAGPQGVYTALSQRTVSDELAQTLVDAGAAEVIAQVSDKVEAEILTPDKESAAVESAPEKAVQRKPAPKKTSKKA